MLLLLTSGLFAETVLLCLSEEHPPLERDDWPVTVVRAVEDGMMDVYFDSGFIVTNIFAEECEGDELKRLADVFGADAAVHIEVVFTQAEEDNLPLPEKFICSIFRRGKGIGAASEILLSEITAGSLETGLQLCTEAGTALAGLTESEINRF